MTADQQPISRRALNRATLARQMLLAREKVTPVAAVERLAGMQAQLARPPFVGLWTRVEGFTREHLARAVARRELVRATMMRGTLHLVSKKDWKTFRPALQPMLTAGMHAILRERAVGLDPDAVVTAARGCFGDGPCTFAQLRDYLLTRFPGVDERAMGYMVRMTLPLIQVPADDEAWSWPGQADFALAETWLGEPIGADDRPGTLFPRYLAAFGPASIRDFQSWSGIALPPDVVDALRPKLRTFRDGRRELFDLPKAPRPDEDVPAPVRYLPEYDNVLLSFSERQRIIADEHKPAVTTRNLFVPATFLIDGYVAGTWKAETKKRVASLTLKPFAALTKAVRATLEDEGERLLAFIEPEAASRAVQIAKT